jgi:cell division protease FtsH
LFSKIQGKALDLALSGLLILAGLLIFGDLAYHAGHQKMPYSQLKQQLRQGRIESVVLGSNTITGKTVEGSSFATGRFGSDPSLFVLLDESNVTYRASSGMRSTFYSVVAPLLLIAGCGFAYHRGRSSSLRAFGKRGNSILISEKPEVGFDEIAGCDEAKVDLTEIVDFLTHPDRYSGLGAQPPRGVLLSGPPGTGKTLLARALAGEAGVPFYSLSGSDFVEMYVGVGAARIRDLFRIARQNSPCIIFIDELDALGKKRDEKGAGNEERENTLNQLLVEMDGFEGDHTVIVIGATNRPDIIDAALVRPGRFDRQITVDTPDRQGRLAILKVHCRGRKLCPDTSLDSLAGSTSGMSGAELANIVNEATLLAARERSECISEEHFSEAVERVLAGPIRTTRILNKALRQRIAYHEAGHALVATYSEKADQVQKVSIVPRGKAALGYTLQLPAADTYLMTEQELYDRIKVLLAGRAAEKIVFGDFSTGAENDLIRASQMAKRILGHFGMSEEGSPIHLGADFRDCSLSSLAKLDDEAGRLLNQLQAEAFEMLERRRDELERVAEKLLEKESLDAEELEALLVRTTNT